MKEILKTVTVERAVTEYEATDGTMFSSKEACTKYEQSAECAIKALYSKLVVKQISEYDLFKGDEYHQVDVVKISNAEEAKIVLQLIKIVSCRNISEEVSNYVKEALETKDYLLLAWNEDQDCVWVINTRNGIIKLLSEL